jgi:hypothetical protein
VAIWQSLHPKDQQRLVTAYMQRAGFNEITAGAWLPRGGDPLWTVIGIA